MSAGRPESLPASNASTADSASSALQALRESQALVPRCLTGQWGIIRDPTASLANSRIPDA